MTEEYNQPERATRRRRIGALLIDMFILAFLSSGLTFLFMGTGWLDTNSTESMTPIMLSVMIPLYIIFFAKDSLNGISPGRWIAGIMVRDANGFDKLPSIGRMFVRNIMIIIWPVEFLVLAFNKNKQRLGDKVSKTVILANPDKPKRLNRVIALVGILILFYTFTALFTSASIKSSEAYGKSIQYIESSNELRDELGEIVGYGMLPNGRINISNGYGRANLEILVKGEKTEMNLTFLLEKEPDGEWVITKVTK